MVRFDGSQTEHVLFKLWSEGKINSSSTPKNVYNLREIPKNEFTQNSFKSHLYRFKDACIKEENKNKNLPKPSSKYLFGYIVFHYFTL